ncbi:MAG: hypothetical protein FWE88_05115 [Phycisphaerae bacterium]|nr:hypothetical protein [Phycisphaerae bacterium]
MQIQQYRGSLANTRRALAGGALTVGYIGGSITTAMVPYNWPEPVSAWFCEHYPRVRLRVENAGIGATGSPLAVFRTQRDLIDRGCDLVFVEFAVNDSGLEADPRMRAREGLLRKLLASGRTDVLLTYTFCQPMYEEMMAGVVPASIADFERLGEHYGLGSIWMGLAGLRDVQAGRMRWEEWLPDTLHPQYRGSLSYARPVIEHVRHALSADAACISDAIQSPSRPMPAPLHARHWQDAYILDWSVVSLDGPWTLARSANLVWMDQVLSTAAVGAKMSCEFEGRALCLAFDFGTNASEYRYRIDGGEPVRSDRDRPDWVGPSGWYRMDCLADDLPPGRHHVEIEVIHGNGPRCLGTNFHLGMIGVVP